MSAPNLVVVRNWARHNAADEHVNDEWRSDFGALADACEKLIRRQERSTVRPGEGNDT